MTNPTPPRAPGTKSAAPAPGADDHVLRYVRQALGHMVAGRPVDLDQICEAHPELKQDVADALSLRAELPSLDKADSDDTDPFVGLVLDGRYTLGEQLGRGGMGAVYAARDGELKRDVAVKILDRHRFFDDVSEQRFLREAEVLATLQHPGVVPVHDRGEHPALLYLVMDRLEGATLSSVLSAVAGADDPLPAAAARLDLDAAPDSNDGRSHGMRDTWPEQACAWIAELADAVSAAHGRGILHRDVKPSNAFIRRDGRAVLLDFGIARRPDDGDLTQRVGSVGTPWYMAPEQARPDPNRPLGPTVDVYGLTATLYHLITGRPPFGGDSASALQRLEREDPPPAHTIVPGLPRDLRAILDKGLERNPTHRYATAGHLAADLRAFLDHQPVSARPISALRRRMRRVRRAPARYVAVAATAIALGSMALAIPSWAAERGRDRAEHKNELLATLPQLLAFEGDPEQRLIADLRPERQRNIDVLDRIVALDPDDVPMRLFRASLHLDQGNHEAAAADLRAAEQRAPTAYLRGVATRYGQSDRTRTGILAVDLSGLPAPESPQDLFVAGFHELRNRHITGYGTRALEVLRRAAEDYLPARDLELIALVAAGDEQGSLALFKEAYDKALKLEERYGYPTARTLAVRGVSLIVQKQYDAAEPLLHESVRLRPDRHGPLTNLGIVYRRLDQPRKAADYLQRAHKLRPHFWNTAHTLAQVHSDLGEYERARELARSIPVVTTGGADWKRAALLADIDLAEAVSLVDEFASAAQFARSRTLAGSAADRYQQAKELAPPSKRTTLDSQRNAALNVASSNNAAAVADLIRSAQKNPTPQQLANIASCLPDAGLDADGVLWLRLLLRTLARDGATGHPQFQAQQDEKLQRTRAALTGR